MTTVDLSNADTYRELRTYAKPTDLHAAIDDLFEADAFWVKVEPLFEANFDPNASLIRDDVYEYILTARFDVEELPSSRSEDER